MTTQDATPTVLIVDDTPQNLTLLREILTQHGYNVRPAINGEIALKSIQTSIPDLILLDIMMDGMDGYEVCMRLKSDASTSDIPILFISALDDTFDKLKAFQIGGVDYITKPFQTAEVLARVEAHLKLHQMQKRLEQQNERLLKEIADRKRVEIELEKSNRELARLVNIDGLTQIANRRYFDTCLEAEWERAIRQKTSLALIMGDIDFFKRFNDTYGHPAGDDCLKRVAEVIQNAVKRPADLAARYGGEEFVVLLPDTDLKGAMTVAREIRRQLGELSLAHATSEAGAFVSLSMGLCAFQPVPEHLPGKLIEAADQALYDAKENGRDRIETRTM